MLISPSCREVGTKILRPAYSQSCSRTEHSEFLFSMIDILTPNKSEAKSFSGVPVNIEVSSEQATQVLLLKGGEGTYVCNERTSCLILSPEVMVIDNTAAGNTFTY